MSKEQPFIYYRISDRGRTQDKMPYADKCEGFKVLLLKRFFGRKSKPLISSVPAFATHIESAFLSPIIDLDKMWNKNKKS